LPTIPLPKKDRPNLPILLTSSTAQTISRLKEAQPEETASNAMPTMSSSGRINMRNKQNIRPTLNPVQHTFWASSSANLVPLIRCVPQAISSAFQFRTKSLRCKISASPQRKMLPKKTSL
jgi:hypothetical protein